MAPVAEKKLNPSQPSISTTNRFRLFFFLGIYSASCFVLMVLAVKVSGIVRLGASASKQWRSERTRLIQTYNGTDPALPWQFRFLNETDIGKTFDSAYASPSCDDWTLVAAFAFIALGTTAIMFLKIAFSQTRLGHYFFEYIFRGVGLTVVLFIPFFLTCTKSLSMKDWLGKKDVLYAGLIRDVTAYTIFHVFLGVFILMGAFAQVTSPPSPLLNPEIPARATLRAKIRSSNSNEPSFAVPRNEVPAAVA